MNGKIVGIGIIVILIGVIGYCYLFTDISSTIATDETIPPIDYMQNIPPKPDDYAMIMREMDSGYVNIHELNKSYWLQPDFYPSWHIAKGFYTSHDYGRWGVYGHGAYPSNPQVIFSKTDVGTWISFDTLYKTGYGIETWQGIKLVPEENEYFDVELTPNQFLLEPTFPVFSEDWVRQINVKVTIKKEPPRNSTHKIKVFYESPDPELSKQWFWEVLRKESSPEEQEMITRAKLQVDREGGSPDQYISWIELGRKNRYVDGSDFQMSERMTIEVIVEE